MDREDWRGADLETLSHPPAPFRLKAICAAFLEVNDVLKISEEEVGVILMKAIRGGDAIMSVAMQRYPYPHWMEEIANEKYDAHFNRLYVEMPKWGVVA